MAPALDGEVQIALNTNKIHYKGLLAGQNVIESVNILAALLRSARGAEFTSSLNVKS